jgi:hypothetical protein
MNMVDVHHVPMLLSDIVNPMQISTLLIVGMLLLIAGVRRASPGSAQKP